MDDNLTELFSVQKMKFPIKDFFSKFDQIRRKLKSVISSSVLSDLQETFFVSGWELQHRLNIVIIIINE